MGLQVAHASMTPASFGLAGQALGGQDVPPGGIAPRAYGSAPQAPASFARNSVDVGSTGLLPLPNAQVGGRKKKMMAAAAPSVHLDGGVVLGRPGSAIRGMAEPAAPMSGGKRAARGAAISKLMKETGMSLPEASRYLKEHGSA
jgi:hypothetical protein